MEWEKSLKAITKKCSKCEREQPIENFRKQFGTCDGLAVYCKTCIKEYNRHRYLKKKPLILEQVKEYRKNHPNRKQILNGI